jgi:hypothetical protein
MLEYSYSIVIGMILLFIMIFSPIFLLTYSIRNMRRIIARPDIYMFFFALYTVSMIVIALLYYFFESYYVTGYRDEESYIYNGTQIATVVKYRVYNYSYNPLSVPVLFSAITPVVVTGIIIVLMIIYRFERVVIREI